MKGEEKYFPAASPITDVACFSAAVNGDILKYAQPFDGVQIDFESIAKADGTAYLNFLVAVKKALPMDKLFSVAVMARWATHKQKNPDDAFDYPFIGMIADRVVIMAYGEHYRGGRPRAGGLAELVRKDLFLRVKNHST